VLGRQRLQLRARLVPGRSRAALITALGVQDRNRRLNHPLIKELLRAARALPDFLPNLVTIEKLAGVEKLDSVSPQMLRFVTSHRGMIA
jgi:hypothetical protein